MKMFEICVRAIMCLWSIIFACGVLTKWARQDFDFEDVFVILFVIMFMSVAIGG